MGIKMSCIAVLTDNYVWVIQDTATKCRAVVDPGEAQPVLDALQDAPVDLILLTHHHQDHVAGVEPLRKATGARVVGARSERHRLPTLDIEVEEGDTVNVGDTTCRVIETPGHTRGHLSLYLPDGPALLTGDTLFSLGCGRLFEGTPDDMFHSLRKFDALPEDTQIYCGHEYTASNLAFVKSVSPHTKALATFETRLNALRSDGEPSLPGDLKTERQLNPFLMAQSGAELGALRSLKDRF